MFFIDASNEIKKDEIVLNNVTKNVENYDRSLYSRYSFDVSPMKSYFSYMGLEEAQFALNGQYCNYFPNKFGSCAYTAMAMLLSYYDTYYDGTLIPSKYEYNLDSLAELYYAINLNRPKESGETKEEYYQNYSESNCLLSKLFELAIEVGALNPNDIDFGLTFDSTVKILNKYINEFNQNFEIVSCTKEKKVLDFIYSGIDLGYPVFVAGTNSKSGHAYITYDYFNNGTETIIVSNSGKGHKISNCAKVYDPKCAFYLKSIGNHYCSNKYTIDDKDFQCICKKANNHNYNEIYLSLGSTYHIKGCSCGAIADNAIKEFHSFRNTVKKIYCTKCDYFESTGGGIRLDSLSYFLDEMRDRDEENNNINNDDSIIN